jgi:hypothetical protein
MGEPQELTSSDTTNGFIVIRVGNIIDESEFHLNAFGQARVYIVAYIPVRSRGRLDSDKYKEMEKAIMDVISDEVANDDESKDYHIIEESLLSSDNFDSTNRDNPYHQFIKSFIVQIDGQS